MDSVGFSYIFRCVCVAITTKGKEMLNYRVCKGECMGAIGGKTGRRNAIIIF